MKNPERVAALLAALKAECETPLELAVINRCEKDLRQSPQIEVIDGTHVKVCGKEFTHHRVCKHLFCSHSCDVAYRRNKYKETRTCAFCGKEFQAYRNGNQKCCSRRCACKLRHAQKEKRYCLYCGEEIKARGNRQKFCSRDCATKYRFHKT